ncbi:hypothetical protein Q5P01_006104 [Channa striata]|uniref:Uncharacterized protein n=1 Tax=Channa striata TaxID=64152 RepID=A0AA88SYE4_CHASR|nr:hypothetical protein Q5P01_006104 [Channa striata]
MCLPTLRSPSCASSDRRGAETSAERRPFGSRRNNTLFSPQEILGWLHGGENKGITGCWRRTGTTREGGEGGCRDLVKLFVVIQVV